MKNIDIEIIKNKNKPDLLLKNGTKVRLGDGFYKKSDVRGIILGSGKIVSLNVYGPFWFSESNLKDYPKERMIGNSVKKAKKDNDGQTNTDLLSLFCEESRINAIKCFNSFDEYLPSVREMLEVIGETDRINNIRKLLNLEPLPNGVRYWTSTIRDEESVWDVSSNGGVRWVYKYGGWYYDRVLSFIDEQ